MMIIKGKRATLQGQRSNSQANPRPVAQKHWPGLLPIMVQQYPQKQDEEIYGMAPTSEAPPSSILAGPNQLFKRELKVPQIDQNNISSVKLPLNKVQGGFEDSIYVGSQYKNQEAINTARANDALGSSSAGPGEQQLLLMQQYQQQNEDNSIMQQLSQEASQLQNTQMMISRGNHPMGGSIQSSGFNKLMMQGHPGQDLAFLMQGSQNQAYPRQSLNQAQASNSLNNRYHQMHLNSGNQESEPTVTLGQNHSLTDQQNISKSQTIPYGGGGGHNGDISPSHYNGGTTENTQFTILKAKLFNPQLINTSVSPNGTVQQPTIQNYPNEPSHSTSHHSAILGQPSQQQQHLLYSGKPPVPAHILNPPRIDENQLLMIYNQQKQQQQFGSNHQLMISHMNTNNNSSNLTQTNQQLAYKYSSATTVAHPQVLSTAALQNASKQVGKIQSRQHVMQPIQQPNMGKWLRQKREQQRNKFFQELQSREMVASFNPNVPNGGLFIGQSAQQLMPNFQAMKANQHRVNTAGGVPQHSTTQSNAIIMPQAALQTQQMNSVLMMSGRTAEKEAGVTTQGLNAKSTAAFGLRSPYNSQKVSDSPQKIGISAMKPINQQLQDDMQEKSIIQEQDGKGAIVIKDGDSVQQSMAYLTQAQPMTHTLLDDKTSPSNQQFNAGSDLDNIHIINQQQRPQTSAQNNNHSVGGGNHAQTKDENKSSSIMTQTDINNNKPATQREGRPQLSQNKSQTMMMSEGSRDEQLVLKPANIHINKDLCGAVDLEDLQQPEQRNIQRDSNAGGEQRMKTSEGTQTVVAQNTELLGTTVLPSRPVGMCHTSQPIMARNINDSQGIGAYGAVSGTQSGAGMSSQGNKRRQLISIDSNNNKKRMFSDIADVTEVAHENIPFSATSPPTAGTKGFPSGLGTLNASLDTAQELPEQEQNEAMKNSQPSHIKLQRVSQQDINQGTKCISTAEISLKNRTQRQQSAPTFQDNLIVRKCQMSQRAHMLYVQSQNEAKQKRRKENLNQLQIKQSGQSCSNSRIENDNTILYNSAHMCQRFLDRGNKPVPPNYEEHDVLPNITNPYSSSSYNGHPQLQKLKSQVVEHSKQPNKNNFKLEDFDEEISGINLSKLFNAYGPSTAIDPDKSYQAAFSGQGRKHRTQGGFRHPREIFNSQSPVTEPQNDYAVGGDFDQNEDQVEIEDQDEQNDYSDEPIVIRLMSNMFQQKKSVQEGIEMLPEINIDKVRRELDYVRAQERARKEKAKRDHYQWERHRLGQAFMKKLPSQSCKNLMLMEYGHELSELRQNPFFLALKENKVERERLELIKQLQLKENGEEQRQELENEGKVQEKVQTDIFKHTFVDAEELQADEEVQPPATEEEPNIMNRPPKDVFSFMNLNFELPAAYYQSFGDFTLATDTQREIIINYIYSHWPQLKNKKLTFKIAFDKQKTVFNVILLGKNCPLSKCCKMTVCFQFDREIGGKVLCMETLCPYNPLDQFFMPSMEAIEELFIGTDSLLMINQQELQADQGIAPDQQHPVLRRIMAKEISKNISKGLHKNGGSIREQLMKSSKLNQAYDKLQNKHFSTQLQLYQANLDPATQTGEDPQQDYYPGARSTIHEATEEGLENSSSINIGRQMADLEKQYQMMQGSLLMAATDGATPDLLMMSGNTEIGYQEGAYQVIDNYTAGSLPIEEQVNSQ